MQGKCRRKQGRLDKRTCTMRTLVRKTITVAFVKIKREAKPNWLIEQRKIARSRSGIAPAPTATDLQSLVHTICERIGRRLERTGKLVRDDRSS
jgi:hypothetical protein